MKVTANADNNTDFEIAPEGSTACRAIRVVDLGTQETSWQGEVKMRRQVCITWEVAETMEDGRPFIVQEIYTASIGDKANLGILLNTWRGRGFTDEEKAGFELSNILGAPGLMSIEHKTTKSGKEKARVGSIIPLPKGMEAPEQVNDSFKFDIEDIEDVEQLKKLWGLERFIIQQSEEFKMSNAVMPDRDKEAENTANTEKKKPEYQEDEMPF